MGEKISRRDFIFSTLATGALFAAGGGASAVAGGKTSSKVPLKAKYALIIDTTTCAGCGACQDACHQRNDLPEGMSYIRFCAQDEGQKCLPVQCQHCADAPCAAVCPANATYHTPQGVVLVNTKLCVGCRYCEVACPYQARRFNEEVGVVDKCWLCLDYVLSGDKPACVQACILGARIFGRQDDPDSKVSQLIASGRAKPLHPEFGTDPAVVHYIIE